MGKNFNSWETELKLHEFAEIIQKAKHGEKGDGIDVFGSSNPEECITDKLPDTDAVYGF